MYWFIDAFYKFVDFKGRSQRAAFWWFFALALLFSFIFSMGDGLFATPVLLTSADVLKMLQIPPDETIPNISIGLLEGMYLALILIPFFALLIRRLHDIGRSGWWLLIGMVPLIGWIVLVLFALLTGKPGPNQYGPNPKEIPTK